MQNPHPGCRPGRSFIPSVVEPSFGIGRIMYCMFEHAYYAREQDAQRTVFAFTPVVAPTKATVFPLVQKPDLVQTAREVSAALRKAGVSNIIDTTGNHRDSSFSVCTFFWGSITWQPGIWIRGPGLEPLRFFCCLSCSAFCFIAWAEVHLTRPTDAYHQLV